VFFFLVLQTMCIHGKTLETGVHFTELLFVFKKLRPELSKEHAQRARILR